MRLVFHVTGVEGRAIMSLVKEGFIKMMVRLCDEFELEISDVAKTAIAEFEDKTVAKLKDNLQTLVVYVEDKAVEKLEYKAVAKLEVIKYYVYHLHYVEVSPCNYLTKQCKELTVSLEQSWPKPKPHEQRKPKPPASPLVSGPPPSMLGHPYFAMPDEAEIPPCPTQIKFVAKSGPKDPMKVAPTRP
ncbi:hypothetical protein ACLB2K_040461 [Fragaria x ananassa]